MYAPGNGGDLWDAAGQGPDSQENWIRIAERLNLCQPSWLNRGVEGKSPCIPSLRAHLHGTCGAAELHAFEVLHGENMDVAKDVFTSISPGHSTSCSICITLILLFFNMLNGLEYRYQGSGCA